VQTEILLFWVVTAGFLIADNLVLLPAGRDYLRFGMRGRLVYSAATRLEARGRELVMLNPLDLFHRAAVTTRGLGPVTSSGFRAARRQVADSLPTLNTFSWLGYAYLVCAVGLASVSFAVHFGSVLASFLATHLVFCLVAIVLLVRRRAVLKLSGYQTLVFAVESVGGGFGDGEALEGFEGETRTAGLEFSMGFVIDGQRHNLLPLVGQIVEVVGGVEGIANMAAEIAANDPCTKDEGKLWVTDEAGRWIGLPRVELLPWLTLMAELLAGRRAKELAAPSIALTRCGWRLKHRSFNSAGQAQRSSRNSWRPSGARTRSRSRASLRNWSRSSVPACTGCACWASTGWAACSATTEGWARRCSPSPTSRT
jgi:hypothetical protein